MEAKFHVKPPCDGVTKICSNGPGHMTKLTAKPIDGKKTLKNLFLRNQKTEDLETWYSASGARVLQVCSNDDLG